MILLIVYGGEMFRDKREVVLVELCLLLTDLRRGHRGEFV